MRLPGSTPAPAKAPPALLMADISSNNANFNARAYRSAGHELIAIKATEGEAYVNPQWSGWTTAAHESQLGIAHYHFCQLQHPTNEARHFWEIVRPHYNTHVDRLVVDLEVGAQADWPAYLAELDAELIRLSGIHATGYTFGSALSPSLKLTSGLWWVAAWGTSMPGGTRGRLPQGRRWGWQYFGGTVNPAGGPAAAAGIGSCDMSVIRPYTIDLIRKGRRLAWPGR